MSDKAAIAIDLAPDLVAEATKSKAWPFEEARKVIARYEKSGFPDTVLFETGYGPSGLPHIGTFGEVARTTMVRHAFRVLTGDKVKTRLLCFFRRHGRDAQDPRQRARSQGAGAASAQTADRRANPFGGDHASFGHHNNAMLRRFLDTFGFDYDFASATDYYKTGRFGRRAAAGGRALPGDHGHHAADTRRGAPRDLFAVFADFAQDRARALRADEGRQCRCRHDHLCRRGRRGSHARHHRRPGQVAVEAGFRRALGRARRRFRDVRQGSRPEHAGL